MAEMDRAPSGRIAFFVPSLAGGGVGRVTLNLVAEGLRRGIEVDLVLSRARGALQDEVPAGARVVVLRRSQLRSRAAALSAAPSLWRELLLPVLAPLRGAHSIAVIRDLVAYLERERPALLIAAKTHTNLAAIWARALSHAPTRLLVSEHTNFSNELRGPKGRKWRWRYVAPLMRAAYPAADLVYAVSNGVAADLASRTGLPREGIGTIYNAVVTEELKRRAREPCDHPWFREEEPPVLLAVGRLDPQKDFETLIRAFARVREQKPARLMILGEGRERARLLTLAQSLGLADDIALPGFASNPLSYMAHADAFVMSSLYEGLPCALIEAMAAGCPVVSTDCPSGPQEILEGGRFGPLVPVGDDTALAEAVLARLKLPRGSETLRARAERFHVSRALDRILALAASGAAEPEGQDP